MKEDVILSVVILLFGILIGINIGYRCLVHDQQIRIVPVFVSVDSSADLEQIEDIVDTVPAVTLSESDFDLLCSCVEAEAGNQSVEGKRLVAAVVLNRVDDSAFPNSISGVIKQKGQFHVVSSGSINRVKVSEETTSAVAAELLERSDYDVLYFRTGGYHYGCRNLYQVGDHYFSTKK